MNNCKTLEHATYLGPYFSTEPEFLKDFQNSYGNIQEHIAFTFSIHWLISCIYFDEIAPSEVTKSMYHNLLDFLNDANARYTNVCERIGKDYSNLRREYYDFTTSFVYYISKECISIGEAMLVNVDGNDIGRLVKKMEICNQLLITFYFTPGGNESNAEKSHTIAMSKFEDKYYIFDINLGVYLVEHSADLGKFIKCLFNVYVPHREINCYSCVDIVFAPNTKQQGGIE